MSDPAAKPTHFVFLLLEEFSHLAFANAVEPLRIANLVSGETLYRWSLASENGETATASNGIVTQTAFGLADIPACDRVFLLSGIHVQDHVSKPLKAALRRLDRQGVALGALCSGAYALAETGLLDDRAAAIHWEFHDSFTEHFPDVALRPTIFVAEGPIYSASGGSATADLMLHLISEAHGEDLAIAVADQMVYTAVREGSAAQRVSLQARSGSRSPRLTEALAIMRGAVETPLSTSEVARRVGVSTRQLERLFGKHLNTSPKRHMLDLRLERARHLLVQTEMSVIDVALACGFENAGHFARVYRSAFGVSPSAQRRALS